MILLSQSYWNDESQVALMARYILENGVPVTNTGYSQGLYQSVFYYLTALSFKVFGVSEWAGRLPSLVAWLLLLSSGVYISRNLFNKKSAIITFFLLFFSQIQLAWATQLRPYIWLELFTLIVVFNVYKYLINDRKILNRHLNLALFVSFLSVLFHGTGLMNLIIVSVSLFYKIIKEKEYKYLTILGVLTTLAVIVVYNSFLGGWGFVKSVFLDWKFDILHYRIFLTHNYLWLIAGSAIGIIVLWFNNRTLGILLGGCVFLIFFIAIFKINPHYVRYSLSTFPLMYLLFSVGASTVIEKFSKDEKTRWFLLLLLFASLSLTGKFIFWPKQYYSINADVRENPIVDYKDAFGRIKEMIESKESETLIIDAWNDRVPWYLPGQKFVMTNFVNPSGIDPMYGEEYVGTVALVKQKIAEHKHGVVIVEDWQSFMSEEIKEYVRKNLKFEFTVQDLPGNENDHWGISVYSWGL